jgi:hypothetical protein
MNVMHDIFLKIFLVWKYFKFRIFFIFDIILLKSILKNT